MHTVFFFSLLLISLEAASEPTVQLVRVPVLSHVTHMACLEILNNSNTRFQRQHALWSEELVRHSVGDILIHHVEPQTSLFHRISADMEQHIKTNERIVSILLYVWNSLSTISWHNDPTHDGAFVVFLNLEWQLNYGGFLMYYLQNDDIRAVPPTKNTGVVMRNHVMHHVSLVNPKAPPRLTVQAWLKSSF
jgi:hypothetical protein